MEEEQDENVENTKDLSGEMFGRLIVLGLSHKAPSDIDGHSYYRCRCLCGKITIVRDTSLTSERTRSCGCLRLKPKSNKGVYVRTTN